MDVRWSVICTQYSPLPITCWVRVAGSFVKWNVHHNERIYRSPANSLNQNRHNNVIKRRSSSSIHSLSRSFNFRPQLWSLPPQLSQTIRSATLHLTPENYHQHLTARRRIFIRKVKLNGKIMVTRTKNSISFSFFSSLPYCESSTKNLHSRQDRERERERERWNNKVFLTPSSYSIIIIIIIIIQPTWTTMARRERIVAIGAKKARQKTIHKVSFSMFAHIHFLVSFCNSF